MVGKILIVDDEQENRGLFRDMFYMILGVDPVNCILCENGKFGWETIKSRQENIILVFTDFKMPEMDGLQLAESIKTSEYESIADVPVVMCTGNSIEVQTDPRFIHINDCYSKPAKADTFYSIGRIYGLI